MKEFKRQEYKTKSVSFTIEHYDFFKCKDTSKIIRLLVNNYVDYKKHKQELKEKNG